MAKTNRLWHEQNRMPKNPSDQQRIEWHLAHARVCSCRPIPKGVVDLMRARGIEVPPNTHKSQWRCATSERMKRGRAGGRGVC